MTTDTARGRIEGVGDTRTARFERVIAHPPDAVWEALTSSPSLDRWFMTASLEPRVGGEASFDAGEGSTTGTVTAWDPPERSPTRGRSRRAATRTSPGRSSRGTAAPGRGSCSSTRRFRRTGRRATAAAGTRTSIASRRTSAETSRRTGQSGWRSYSRSTPVRTNRPETAGGARAGPCPPGRGAPSSPAPARRDRGARRREAHG